MFAPLTNIGAIIGTPDAWGQHAANVREKGLVAMAGEIVLRWFGPNAYEEQPALLDGWKVIMGRGDANSYALLCEMLGKADFREKLRGRDVPVLLIAGTDDLATPPDSLGVLAQFCGSPDPVIMEGIGHVPSVECPAQKSSPSWVSGIPPIREPARTRCFITSAPACYRSLSESVIRS